MPYKIQEETTLTDQKDFASLEIFFGGIIFDFNLIYKNEDENKKKKIAEAYVHFTKKYTAKGYSVGLIPPREMNLGVDLVIYNKKQNPFFIIKVSDPKYFTKEREKTIKTLYDWAPKTRKKLFLIHYSHQYNMGKLEENYIVINYKKYPTLTKWNAGGRKTEKIKI